MDSEDNKRLKKENYVLNENSIRQHYIFKSTISTLLELFDNLVFKPFNEANAVKLNNNVFDNTAEALKAYNTASNNKS